MAVASRVIAAALLVGGCRGFPCTDDVGFPDDATFVSFVPAEEWPDGAYRIEITIDHDLFACELDVPVESATTTCSEGLGFAESGPVPDDSRRPNELVIDHVVSEDEVRVTVERADDVVVDEVITDFVRDDRQAKDRGKVCEEWSTVSIEVRAP